MLKKSIFICVLIMVCFGWNLPILADQNTTDQAENMVPSPGLKAAGNILWHCDVQHLALPDSDDEILGIETLRDTIYTTGAYNETDPNKVHVWLRTGGTCQYLYSVNQPAASTGWGWRDLACDGNYLYASFSTVLNCFYVTPGGAVLVPANNITFAALNPIRAVAYDPVHNWFWAANFSSSIYAFNRSGVQQASYANTKAIYGLAYDNVTPGGPYLWCHVQDSCNVYQFSIASGTYTGVVYSGWGDDDPGYSGIAGGLCVMERGPSYKGNNVTLLGITQMVSPNIDEMYAMEIYVAPESLYWKPSYPDYAPNGMPDLDQHQDNWYKYETSVFSFCGPVAVANCFKWFDSKYNVPPGVPGDGMDMFPLVREYIDALGGMLGPYDDHDPFNMNHQATPWLFGGTPPPPPTLQPFLPGHQNPGMPPWGELVERLSWYFDTDGVRTQYCSHSGTNILDMQQGILMWFESEHFPNGSTLADTLCEKTWQMPTFEQVGKLVEKCEDVILLLGFWWFDNTTQHWFRCGGHYVTVAGINRQDHLIAISDPTFDNAEMGAPGIVGDGLYITHAHGSHDATVHNDEGNVSHDIYPVEPSSPVPAGLWILPTYPVSANPGYCYDFALTNIPIEFIPQTQTYQTGPLFTVVEYAVDISPWDYRGDINVPGGNGVVDIGDVVFLINYLFKSGPVPNPLSEGDVNCDTVVDIGDVVFLINYLFKHGNVPKCCD